MKDLTSASPFELLDAAFRRACVHRKREELLALGTFPTTYDYYSTLLAEGNTHAPHCGCRQDDAALFGITFNLNWANDVDCTFLGRIDYDVEGEALRLRALHCFEDHDIGNSYALCPAELRTSGLEDILSDMLEAPELAELERRTFKSIHELPIASKLLVVVSKVTGLDLEVDVGRPFYHDYADELAGRGMTGKRVLPIKLWSFELSRYPRGDYFGDHTSGPVQLQFWVQPDEEGSRVVRISAFPYYTWWMSSIWNESGPIVSLQDLHITHRRFIKPKDQTTLEHLMLKWRELAGEIASELGSSDVVFELRGAEGSYVRQQHLCRIPSDPPGFGALSRRSTGDRYLRDRIRLCPPDDCYVLHGSTPIVAFGDWSSATVATLGLNPSRREFTDAEGVEIEAGRRFHTAKSLGTMDFSSLRDEQVQEILEHCQMYFRRNPYRRWFDVLETYVLNELGLSYYGDAASACHLDLVQWATEPTWGKLASATQEQLLRDVGEFFLEQLKNTKVQVLLLNGQGVISGFEKVVGRKMDLHKEAVIEKDVNCCFYSTRLEDIVAIGWTTNLQSSFGVTSNLRAAVGKTVRTIYTDYFVCDLP